jgi:multiple sugar transport system substrate-binding protein
MQAAGGNELQILRLPSLDGTKGANLWYKSGQFQSINSQSKSSAAGKFLDYYFNSMDAGKVLLAERGLPSNTTVLDGIQTLLADPDKKASAYLKSIEPDLRAAPVAPPPGVSTFQTMFNRAVQNVQFGKASSADAAKALYDEAKASIK